MILYRPIPTWPIPLLALLAAGCTEYDLSSLTGNHGREFLAVDLDNDDGDEGVESADAQPAALVVGNPGETGAVAEIEIWRRGLDEAPLRGEGPPTAVVRPRGSL